MLHRLTEEQCRVAVRDGEFGKDLLESSRSVALVLTQHWCPQWLWMRVYLDALPDAEDERIFYVEYDREVFYDDFLAFKEDRLGNRAIPYVRFYRDGTLRDTSNYISRDGFLRLLRG